MRFISTFTQECGMHFSCSRLPALRHDCSSVANAGCWKSDIIGLNLFISQRFQSSQFIFDFGFVRQNRAVSVEMQPFQDCDFDLTLDSFGRTAGHCTLTVRQLYGEPVNTAIGFVFAISCFPPTSGPGSSAWMEWTVWQWHKPARMCVRRTVRFRRSSDAIRLVRHMVRTSSAMILYLLHCCVF